MPHIKTPIECQHDLTEKEVACADGLCPLCLRNVLMLYYDALTIAAKETMREPEDYIVWAQQERKENVY